MEIDWAERQRLSYARDGARAVERFMDGDRSQDFLIRALELLRTYTEAPGVGAAPHPADETMVLLAQAINAHVSNLGFWRQVDHLWPRLCAIAKLLPEQTLYVELMKHLATIRSRQGEGDSAQSLYAELMELPSFVQLPAYLRADVLQQAGTTQLWHGQPRQAKATLLRCLAIEEETSTGQLSKAPVDQFGVRASATPTPLWESKVYALNQLGNLALFHGNFADAATYFDRCQALFTAHGEAENLACVAYQAIGVLLLYTHRPQAAIPVIEQGLAIRKQRHEREGVAVNSIYLAAAYLALKQERVAEALLTEALTTYRTVETRHDLALCHLYLGQLAALRNDWMGATDHWRHTLTLVSLVMVHFVELRLWVAWLPRLLVAGQFGLAFAIVHCLWCCTRAQQLRLGAIWRLVTR